MVRGLFFENFIRAPQLDVLAFELPQSLALVCRQAWSLAGIALRLSDPAPQRFHAAAQFLADRSNRCRLRSVLRRVLLHQTHCALTKLGGILRGSSHGPHPLAE